MGFGSVVAASAFATAGPASAATLYTDGTHTTPVAVSTTASASLLSSSITFSGPIDNESPASTLTLSLTQNSGGVIGADITDGTFPNGNPLSVVGNFDKPWQLVISGSSSTNVWTSASINNVNVTFGGIDTFTGNLTSGVSATQPSSGPPTVSLVNAGTLTGSPPIGGSGTVTGEYELAGTAASFSIGNP